MSPKLLVNNEEARFAPFMDATGAHAGALLGDVRHDPYQSGGLGTPAHERVEAGMIHKANRGVLYIDEIGTMSMKTQQELLSAMQEKQYAITGQSENSTGAFICNAGKAIFLYRSKRKLKWCNGKITGRTM